MHMRKGDYINVTGGFVYDGDTFTARTDDGKDIMIRIYGIDAPEKTQFGADFTTDRLKELVLNERLQLYYVDKDHYDRSVCVVHRFKDDVDVGFKLLGDGLAKYSIYGKSNALNANKYALEQERSKALNRGLWKAGDKFSDPRDHRDSQGENGKKFESFSEADAYDKSEKIRISKLYEKMRNDEKNLGKSVDLGGGRKSVNDWGDQKHNYDSRIMSFLGQVKERFGGFAGAASKSEREFRELEKKIITKNKIKP